MSFEHAPVTKVHWTSIVCGIFDVKHYLHLQLVPHMSRNHQYWRLLLHHTAFSNSSDLLIAEILLYGVGCTCRTSVWECKFASFTVGLRLLATILEFLTLILFHNMGINKIPSGPSALLFSILYQWYRLIPPAYHFRIFGIAGSNKAFVYILASQLALGHLPGSFAPAAVGLLTGFIYRSELVNIKSWRLTRFLLPLVGSTRAPRRSTRARPETTHQTPSPDIGNEEIIATARPSAGTEETGGSVMREGNEQGTTGVRVPSDAEITQVTTMFPNMQRAVIVGALQRSPNIESAVELLLAS
ncbi:hypothetical protein BD769DRAFT_1626204 [Suillus cothurnatus]|nr:hypothetical protein BD769DRAFT_1626204 [Suillus cothurnatus]